MRTRQLTIQNKRGLHARASAQFVKCVARFNASITVTKDGHCVGGSSIMGLMMLGAASGSQIIISGSGPEAQLALDALEQLINDRFGED